MSKHTHGTQHIDNDPDRSYNVNSYTDDKTGEDNIVVSGDSGDKNPHSHETSSGHADVTNADGSKTENVTKNDSFWLQGKTESGS